MNHLNIIYKRVFICVICIVFLFLIMLNCFKDNSEMKSEEYIKTSDAIGVISLLCEINDMKQEYDECVKEQMLFSDEYVLYSDYKQINQILPLLEEQTLSKEYKEKDCLLEKDWLTYLDKVITEYGKQEVQKEALEIIAFSNQLKEENDLTINEDTLLTNNGIYEYENINDFGSGSYEAITYQNRIILLLNQLSNTVSIKNAYIMNQDKGEITFFYNHYQITYPTIEMTEEKDVIADIFICDSKVTNIQKKEDRFTGKLIYINSEEAEIEDFGIYKLSKDIKLYKLFGKLHTLSIEDLRVGYTFTDFVVEDGYICAALVMRDEDMDVIRVLIRNSDYQGKLHESIDVSCDTDYSVQYYKNGIKSRKIEIEKGEVFHIGMDDFKDNGNRIKIVPSALSGNMTILNVNRSQGNPSYRGDFEIEKCDDGLILINEVLLEEYLYRVVPSEMPAYYAKEALKAQAVCARTYAYGKMLHAGLAGYGAHLDDSATFQVYNNILSKSETTEAVKETLGEILQYQNEPIGAYYYSTSCGVSTDTGVWKSENPPYINAKLIGTNNEKINADDLTDEDNFRKFIETVDENNYEKEEGYYRWTYNVENINSDFMLKQLKARFDANPNLILTQNKSGEYESKEISKIGNIKDIKVMKRNPGGVIDELVITGSKATIKVISELNVRYILCDGETKLQKQDKTEVSLGSSLPSAFLVINLNKENGYVTGYKLIGGGFGHGVGMSQNAAREMGNLGMNYRDILAYFYEDSDIKIIKTKGE